MCVSVRERERKKESVSQGALSTQLQSNRFNQDSDATIDSIYNMHIPNTNPICIPLYIFYFLLLPLHVLYNVYQDIIYSEESCIYILICLRYTCVDRTCRFISPCYAFDYFEKLDESG